MPPGVEVLQGGVARGGRHGAAVGGGRSCLGEVDPLGGGNRLQLAAQAVADGLYMGTVAVAADARAEDRLRQIVADVQPELGPDLLADMLGHTEMNARVRKQRPHRLHPVTVKRCGQLPVDDADGRLRVKTHTVLGAMGGHLDERGQHMSRADLCGDELLAVNAVHQAHDNGAFAHNGADAVQCAGQCTVFQRDDQQIDAVGLLRGPDLRVIDLPVDCAAVLLQPLGAGTLRHDAKLQAVGSGLVGQAPQHIAADGSGPQNSNRLNFHRLHPPVSRHGPAG